MSTNGQSVITLTGVTKVFYTDEVETHALAGIHLEIPRGQYISIAGPSGCGKSTLLSILGLLDTPSDGGYVLNGRSVADLPLAERARVRNREIGFIFQSFNLIGDLTVYENVELPLTYRGMKATERKERVMAALEKVEMSHRVEAPAEPALRRSAAARRRRPRGLRLAVDPAGRRADRQPRLEERRIGDDPAAGTASGRRDDLHGHPRPALRAARRALHPPLRRPHRRGKRERGRDARDGRERIPHRALTRTRTTRRPGRSSSQRIPASAGTRRESAISSVHRDAACV